MIDLQEKDYKELEQKCHKAVQENDLDLFDLTFNFMQKNISAYNYFLGYKLLNLLAKSKEEFYFLVETIEDFDDKYIKFVFEVERSFNLRNKAKLQKLKEKMPEYSHAIEMLLNYEEENKKTNDEGQKDKEKNEEMIKECLHVIEDYNKI